MRVIANHRISDMKAISALAEMSEEKLLEEANRIYLELKEMNYAMKDAVAYLSRVHGAIRLKSKQP